MSIGCISGSLVWGDGDVDKSGTYVPTSRQVDACCGGKMTINTMSCSCNMTTHCKMISQIYINAHLNVYTSYMYVCIHQCTLVITTQK